MKTEYFERIDDSTKEPGDSNEHYRTSSQNVIPDEELKISYTNGTHGCFLTLSFNKRQSGQYSNDKYWRKILKRLRDALYLILGLESRIKKHHEFIFKNPNQAKELASLLTDMAEKVDSTVKLKEANEKKEHESQKESSVAFTEKQFSKVADIIIALKDVPEYRESISELRMIFHILGKDTRKIINDAERKIIDEKDRHKGLIDK